ncbi:MAG: hypothetical protein K2W97_02200 [Chthoniobacterales bacterium]|nr:hypothetical protein [Chthoniobacterales bacterium]
MQDSEFSEAEIIIKESPLSSARIFHTSHSEAKEKADETRRRKDFDQGCMKTYCPDQNSTTTQSSSALAEPQTERHEISGLQWQVIHLRYPRETEIVSSLKIKWVVFGKIKVPKIFFQQKRVEKQEASVNYDLLCSQMESFLNDYSTKGYELFSMTSTHSGFSSIVQTTPRPQSRFFKATAPKSSLHAEEALVLIFKRK